MKRYVVDTGPLLHLLAAGAWGLLPHLGTVETTPIVAAELTRLEPTVRGNPWPKWLPVVTPSTSAKATAQSWVQAGLLHPGEAEALAYAGETGADVFLTDDTEAREMAGTMGIEARGSLGVVLMAAARGLILRESAMAHLNQLENHSTLWLSKKVRQAARSALEEIYRTR